MRRITLLFASLLSIMFLVQSVSASGTSDNFHLYVPANVYEGTTSTLLIKVLSPAGVPISGMANNISCYMEDPIGTPILSGSHPTEKTAGVYLLYFTAGQTTGTYKCWATCVYSAAVTELDAELFTVTWDPYDNISRLYERIGSVIYLERWDNTNLTQIFSNGFAAQDKQLTNISQQTKSTDFNTNLQHIAMEQAVGTFFWMIILVAVGLFGAVFYSHRKGKKERQKLFGSAVSIPQSFVGEVVEYGRKRGK